MSGAQGKAAEIAGAVSIIAEVDDSRIETRYTQGWVSCSHRQPGRGLAHGPGSAWQARSPVPSPTTATWWICWNTCTTTNIHVDLLSDQTSCHVPYDGGYCPQGLTFAAAHRDAGPRTRKASGSWWTRSLRHHYRDDLQVP